VVERVPADAPAGALLIQVASVPHALRRIAETLRAAHPIPMVGITGSMGKTTTKDVLAAVLGARYRVLRTAASYNNEIGVPLTLLRLEPTHEVGVIELGFYVPGEIADLCALVRPRIGIITAIPDRPPHFSRTPSLEAIANGKAELIAALPTAAAGGVALLNADDPRVRGLAGRTAARLLLYGESDDAAVRATDVRVDGLDGISFQVALRGSHGVRAASAPRPAPPHIRARVARGRGPPRGAARRGRRRPWHGRSAGPPNADPPGGRPHGHRRLVQRQRGGRARGARAAARRTRPPDRGAGRHARARDAVGRSPRGGRPRMPRRARTS